MLKSLEEEEEEEEAREIGPARPSLALVLLLPVTD